MNTSVTDFLLSKSTFLGGAGAVINIAGDYYAYNQSGTPQEADAKALFKDLLMIKEDFRKAIQKIGTLVLED